MVDVVYLYEGGLDSLLGLILFLIKSQKKPFMIKERSQYEPNLLDYFICPNINIPKNIIDIWKRHIGEKVFRQVYYVFLSSNQEKEIIIYYFLKNALKYKSKILTMRNLLCVNKTLKIAEYVKHENHKLKGFLRFSLTSDNFLYARISPTNDILSLLSWHFIERLKGERFVIHDVLRNKYCFYDSLKPYFVDGKDIIHLNVNILDEEKEIEDLWKSFFETVAIKERENLKCQMNFMPKKYWKYMLEMSDEN